MGALLPAALQATEDAGNQKSPAKFSSHVQQAPAIHLRARCKPRAAPEPPAGSCSAPASGSRHRAAPSEGQHQPPYEACFITRPAL